MSASFALPEQIDGLEKLLTLASLKKEDIAANAEEARKQLKLTQETLGKVAEAKSYISQHASLAADVQRREDELAQGNKNLTEEKQKHAEFIESENTRLEKFAAELTAKEKEQAIIAQRLANQEGELKAAIVEYDRQNQEAVSACQKIQVANANDKKANEVETERLKEWENTLKGKAQRLRDQAANF